jgi:hypothetical protein
MIKGRKFIIPFWDDPYAKHVPGERYGTIRLPTPEEEEESRRAEAYVIPLFEDPFYDLIFSGDRPEVTYFSEKLDKAPVELIQEVQDCQERISESTGKSRWIARGKLYRALDELVRVLT